MPPRPRRPSSSSAGPVRRPVVGASKAKANPPATSARKERPKAPEKTKASSRKPATAGRPTRKKVERTPSMSMASSKFSLKDSSGRRLSHDEYMDSASSRMKKLQQSLGKTTNNTFDEAAEAPAMSMMDLLASLDDMEGSGLTEQGVFNAHILQFTPNIGIALTDVDPKAPSVAPSSVSLKLKPDHFIIEDETGSFVTDPKYPNLVTSLQYKELKMILWDHQHSSLKFRTLKNNFIILAVENSLELEREMTSRFAEGIDSSLLSLQEVPSFSYLGMFAGPTKPKPFERKRANLTQLKQSKMPALTKMREIAMERHYGPERPKPMEFSRRTLVALDHIHDGQVSFTCFAAALPKITYCNNATVVMDWDGVVFENNTDVTQTQEEVPDQIAARTVCLFEDISAWGVYDLGEDATENGIQLECRDELVFFAVDDINNFRVCFEYFWNLHRAQNLGLSPQPGTTHGRKVMGLHTLVGEVRAPDPPEGNFQVVDSDGKVLKPSAVPQRKKSFAEKLGSAIFGDGVFSQVPTSQRSSVRTHWGKVVKHNGWLNKQGGMMKSWLRRYFVLYKTSQGHFLAYYSQYWESPLYNPHRKERNLIDLSKVTFLRARSKNRDAPPFSFDIATIEREWTLCANDHEDLQLWLQLLANAVDEDVAIVPDDTMSFMVRARQDPSGKLDPYDYTTVLQISTWGVSVQMIDWSTGYRKELCFWCYTDFYKWYVVRKNKKTALSVQIFQDGDFKKKIEFVFRTPDAETISTAIEYYIEKFMTRMHLRRELEEAMAAPKKEISDEPAADEPPKVEMNREVATKEMAPEQQQELPLSPPPLPNDFEQAKTFTASEVNDDEGYGNDLEALFTSELKESIYGDEDVGMSVPGGGDTKSILTENDMFPDEEDADEENLMYAAYNINVDVADVDEPEMIENAFAPDNDFFSGEPPQSKKLPEAEESEVEYEIYNGAEEKETSDKFEALLYSLQGALMVNDHLDVYYRHEYLGSQARITCMYRNLSETQKMTNFNAVLSETMPYLRKQLPPTAKEFAPGSTQTQMGMLELYRPYDSMVKIEISFALESAEGEGGDVAHHKYLLPLPISLYRFMSPVILTFDDFQTRWGTMESSEVIESGPCKKSMDPASLNSIQAALRRLKLGISLEKADDGWGDEKNEALCCSAVLNTKSLDKKTGKRANLGFLANIFLKKGKLTVVVRSADQAFSGILATHLVNMLGGSI